MDLRKLTLHEMKWSLSLTYCILNFNAVHIMGYFVCVFLQSIAEEKEKSDRHMTSVKGVLTALFKTSIYKCYPTFNIGKGIIKESGAERFGDYKCLAAMALAKVSGGMFCK